MISITPCWPARVKPEPDSAALYEFAGITEGDILSRPGPTRKRQNRGRRCDPVLAMIRMPASLTLMQPKLNLSVYFGDFSSLRLSSSLRS